MENLFLRGPYPSSSYLTLPCPSEPSHAAMGTVPQSRQDMRKDQDKQVTMSNACRIRHHAPDVIISLTKNPDIRNWRVNALTDDPVNVGLNIWTTSLCPKNYHGLTHPECGLCPKVPRCNILRGISLLNVPFVIQQLMK